MTRRHSPESYVPCTQGHALLHGRHTMTLQSTTRINVTLKNLDTWEALAQEQQQ